MRWMRSLVFCLLALLGCVTNECCDSGAELVITATGTVFERIEQGAYVDIVVKYGLIRLLATRADLCEQIQNVDLECPIEKGVLSITKSVEIPKEVPPVSLITPGEINWRSSINV